MSTSQRVPLRRTRRPGTSAGGDPCLPQSPREVKADGHLFTHSPAHEQEERFGSVLLSSRSTTTSLTRLQTPSKTAHGSALTDAPLSYSPQMAPRNGGKLSVGVAPTAGGTTTAETVVTGDDSGSGQGHRIENFQDSVKSNDRDSKRGGSAAVDVTPEKMVANHLPDDSNDTPSLQVERSADGKMEESARLRPIEESLSFEFYSGNQRSGSCRPSTTRANNLPSDARLPRGMVMGGGGGGNFYRESPMAPNTLPMVLIPDSFSQRCVLSSSSRDQQPDGRYAAMSQSSRFEDAHQLTPRPLDEDTSLTESTTHHRVPLLDDTVRHSTTESFVTEDGVGCSGVGGNSTSAQPPRVDASMNSQNFIRNYKRRQAAKGRGGNVGGVGNGRYNSTSISSSPQTSADVAAPSGGNTSLRGGGCAPEVFSSDQLTHAPTSRKKRCSGNNTNSSGGGVAADGGTGCETPNDRHDANVLGMHSSDFFVPAGGTATGEGSSSPFTDDFSIVRAPVTGLRAKVLGNVAVDEDEAAEDPEARELLTRQIQNFVMKVVKQRHNGADSGPPQQLQLQQSPSAAPEPSETRAEILRRANAEGANEAAVAAREPCDLTPLTSVFPATSQADDVQPLHTGSPHTPLEDGKVKQQRRCKSKKKATKRVRFNLQGLTPRDEEGPNALQMPRHGAVWGDSKVAKRQLSPPALVSIQSSGSSSADNDGSPKTPAKRHNSLIAVDVRSVLRAGVAEQGLPSPSSPAVEKAPPTTMMAMTHLDTAEVVLGSKSSTSPKLTRYSTTDYSVRSPVQGQESSRDEEDQSRQHTPVTPDKAFVPVPMLPSTLVALSTKSAPVPPAPTAISGLTSSAQEPEKKHKPSGKVRKATKMHRKAAVALVAGGSESNTLAQPSNASSLQRPQQAPLELVQASPLSSVEVCMPDNSQHFLCISFCSPTLVAPSSMASVSVSNALTTAVSVGSPKRTSTDSDASTPMHRVPVSDLKSKAVAAVPVTMQPPLRGTQVVALNQSSVVPVFAETTTTAPKTPITPSKCGEVSSRRQARRGSAEAASAVVTARAQTATAAAPAAKAGATAPSSRRSSTSLACTPGSKSGTLAELPPLSASTRSRTSTPDVALPPTTPAPLPNSTSTVLGHGVTATPSLNGEAHVVLPSALTRRPSASHETVFTSNSAGEFSGGGSGGGASPPGLRRERSCSTVEYKGDRDVSPLSTGSSNRSITCEPLLNAHTSTKAAVLPRLSSNSLRQQQ